MSFLDSYLSSFFCLELKRVLSLKMQEAGISTDKISKVLQVSDKFVSKWKLKYASEGASCLPVQHEGRPSYLSASERAAVIEHISVQKSYTLSKLVLHIQDTYGITFKSKQSYYSLLSEGGMSWHRTEKTNPKKNEGAVLERRSEIKKNWIRNGKKLNKKK